MKSFWFFYLRIYFIWEYLFYLRINYAVHSNETFFLDVCEDSLSIAHLFIIINDNFTEYSSNVTLLYTNYINKYITTVSSKKIIENILFFYRINLTPPPLIKDIWPKKARVERKQTALNAIWSVSETETSTTWMSKKKTTLNVSFFKQISKTT